MAKDQFVTGTARSFKETDVIVSKTDAKGIISYVNRTFIRISDYSEAEVLGKPHNIIRHPDMPRAVFRLMWDRIQGGREIFAYVINRCKGGDHYWVLAHVTPSFDGKGALCGFHSNRRSPNAEIVARQIAPLYAEMRRLERDAADPRHGMDHALAHLNAALAAKGVDYDRFFFA